MKYFGTENRLTPVSDGETPTETAQIFKANLTLIVINATLCTGGGVREGGRTELTCSYQASPDHYIDSIKWYLNSSEIYRIVPGLTQDR